VESIQMRATERNTICFLSPAGLEPENYFAGEHQKQFETTDQSSGQRGHPTSTNPQLSDSYKKSGRGPQWGGQNEGWLAN
jgi:hypothetical protein